MPRSIFSPEVLQTLNDAQRHPERSHPSPADWRDVWMYFLITDRFNNPQMPPRQPWNAEVGTFQGGTFAGIMAQLPYLKALGVGALWISPVLKNPQYDEYAHHGYGVQDFLNIDPRFSSDPERAKREPAFVEGELRALVDAAHAQGIYIIFDIVLNHVGNVFAYEGSASDAPWHEFGTHNIWWRDADGTARPDWPTPPQDPSISQDALIWPIELQRNEYFRRKGNAFSRPMEVHEFAGDFYSLKEIDTGYFEPHPGLKTHFPVRYVLIVAHEYLIAKYDIDGFRIDTLKYIEPEFAREFGAAMREYAESIGKRNFFTFGEVYDQEDKIARFIGRVASQTNDLIGIDAALDFPLFFKLPAMVKGQVSPAALMGMYERRKQLTQTLISSQGEATSHFVTFIDNHDQHSRFHYVDPSDPHKYDCQTTLALALLFTLQGIPCLYYGTEQGLHGHGGRPEAVREALWGMPNAFDQTHPFFKTISTLAQVRLAYAALRYGRQYFRPISGDGVNYGYSVYNNGVLAFSRLLADLEVVVVANISLSDVFQGRVMVDYTIRPGEYSFKPLYSNQRAVETLEDTPSREAFNTNIGTIRAIAVDLLPCEVQIWGKGV
ncbi:MAG: alpha-amylase family glycosyl hydrolase [Anaerolineae bacterium]